MLLAPANLKRSGVDGHEHLVRIGHERTDGLLGRSLTRSESGLGTGRVAAAAGRTRVDAAHEEHTHLPLGRAHGALVALLAARHRCVQRVPLAERRAPDHRDVLLRNRLVRKLQEREPSSERVNALKELQLI